MLKIINPTLIMEFQGIKYLCVSVGKSILGPSNLVQINSIGMRVYIESKQIVVILLRNLWVVRHISV